jgi:SAM-dependent methyltransferase
MADNTEIKSCAAMDSACAKLETGCHDEKYTGTIEADLASELNELRRQLRAANSALVNLGKLNPRHPGLHNDAIQLVKRLIGRCLNWYSRPLRGCLVAVVASLNEMEIVLEALTEPHREAIRRDLLERSQKRWKGSEPDASLTWGEIFTGDSFIDALQAFYRFDPLHHICEVGPGYGRLLHTILKRQLPFRRYTAVELSSERVRMLREKFVDPRVKFVQGDINQIQFEENADLVICSSTFEHLFPDFTCALGNISNQLNPQGCVAIDFVQAEPRMEHRQQGFEPIGDAFVRIYSKDEIQSLFRGCGLVGLQVGSIALGKVSYGEIRRIFVFACRQAASVQAITA